jgi:hypothetical protein
VLVLDACGDGTPYVPNARYHTKASQKYVRGFRSAKRRQATIEFVPR